MLARLAAVVGSVLATTGAHGSPEADPFKLEAGDVVAFVGGTDMVHIQKAGYFEASLTNWFRAAEPKFRDLAWEAKRIVSSLLEMEKPIICRLNGAAAGLGATIALLCDMVIAAEDAVFAFPPARDLGALPNNMWLYNVGPQWAKRLTLTGDSQSYGDHGR